MKIGVYGCGVVGNAIVRGFAEHVDDVLIYDIDETKRTATPLELVEQCDFIFICLPTPRGDYGPLDTTLVVDAVELLSTIYRRVVSDKIKPPIVVIKSTVNPGTCEYLGNLSSLKIVHSPEFLTARCAILDFASPSRNVIGFTESGVDEAAHLAMLYRQRWPHCQLHVMKATQSELVKLGINGFFAVKVGYFHALAKTCERLGVDYRAVREAIVSDGRLTGDHTLQPGPDGQFGFGGACLPKDLAAFAAAAGNIAPWLVGVSETNDLSRLTQ